MSDPNRPHDALFKKVFSITEHAASILRQVLPVALARRIDWSSLALCSGSHVDALLADSHADLLFSARLEGKPAMLYLLFEHQSSCDELMPLRLLTYVVRVLEWHIKEAASRGEPVLPLHERGLGLLPSLALWAMRDARDRERIELSLHRWAPLMNQLATSSSDRDALFTILRYLSVVSELSPDAIYAIIQSQAPEAKDVLMTLAEQWKAEGEAKGRTEAKVASILQILKTRQKVLTPAQRAIIEHCSDIACLDAWFVKAVTLNDASELFAPSS
jgi:predicted transposase YdaD